MLQFLHLFFWVTLCVQPLIHGVPTRPQRPLPHPALHSRGKRALGAAEEIVSEGPLLRGSAARLGQSPASYLDPKALSHITPGDVRSTKLPELNPLRDLKPETPQPKILQLGRNSAEKTQLPVTIDPAWSADWKRLGLDENLMADLFNHLGLARDAFPKPNFAGVRSAAEAKVLRPSAPFNDRNGLEWFLTRFETSKLHRFEPEELYQTLQYYISRFWDPQDFDQVSGMPNWVISRYVKEWTETRAWNREVLIEWGHRLGISGTGVVLIDENSKMAMAHLLASGKQYMEWFENANMASLSSSSQRILNINVRYANKNLWWTAKDVARWTQKSLPLDLMVEIGTVLHLAETSLPAQFSIPRVRLDMARLLDKYESIVYKSATENQPFYRSLLANELAQSTSLEAGSLFQQRISAIGLTDGEKSQFAEGFRQGDLKMAFEPNRMNHFHIQWYINRLDFVEAEEFTPALAVLYSVRNRDLLSNKERMAPIMRAVLPSVLGGEIKDWSTYRAYIKIYEDALGPGSVRATIARNMLTTPVNEVLTLWKSVSQKVVQKFKPLANWLTNLFGKLRKSFITTMSPLTDFARDLKTAWQAFGRHI